MTRAPAEVFPPGEFLADEPAARGWTALELAERMGGDVERNLLAVSFLMHTPIKGLLLGHVMAGQFAAALGTDPEYWLNLDAMWQAAP
jgi:HTH-type transcriptional regulator/antitoxin HigA